MSSFKREKKEEEDGRFALNKIKQLQLVNHMHSFSAQAVVIFFKIWKKLQSCKRHEHLMKLL